MKHFLSLLTGMFLFAGVSAQTPSNTYIDAQTHINNGVRLHDDEKYEEAIAEYRKVNPNDSLYSMALYEAALSYSAMENHEKTLSVLSEMKAAAPSIGVEYYILLGSTLDDMGRSDESVELFKEVYPQYSHISLFGYNYAMSLYRAGKYDEAEEILQRAVRINPYHFRSHYALGLVNYAQGRIVPALLCFAFAANLGNDLQCHAALVAFESAVNGTLDVIKGKAAAADAVNNRFADLETMITSNFVQNKKFVPKTKIDLLTTRRLQFLVENVHIDDSATDIYNQFYVPYFSEVNKKNYVEPYIVNSLRFSDDKTVTAALKKNKSSITNYLSWAKDYIENGRTHVFNPADKNYYTFSKTGINDCGQYADAEKTVPTGKWVIYHSNGPVKVVIDYAQDGSGGDFTAYYSSGEVRRKGALKNGEIHGLVLQYHDNGVLSEKATYNEGKQVDTAYTYTTSGQLRDVSFYGNGERTGERTLYFENGQKSVVSNYVDGERTGKYDAYFANGKQWLTGMAKNDELDGIATYYYSTGQQNDLLNYSDGKQVGEQKEWHPNGQLKSVYSYNKAGLLSGWYKEYYSNGVLEDSVFYNDKGELSGTGYFYDTDGKQHYTTAYKNGKKESYTYYNKAGAKTQTVSLKDGVVTSYYPNGAVRKTGTVKNGLREGLWTTYDSQGRVRYTENVKQDKAHGELLNYYSNGELYNRCYYSTGELDGYNIKYYRSGNKKSEGYYEGGKKVGEWKEYSDNGVVSKNSYYNNEGELQGWEEEYTVDGKLELKKLFANGRLYAYVTYNSNGQVEDSCALQNGNGLLQLKYPNGVVRYRANIIGGKYNGMLERRAVNGVVTYKGNYIDDKEDGTLVWYNADGAKFIEQNWVLGKKHGISKEYFRDGTLSKEEEYMLGTLQKHTQYYKNGVKMLEYTYDSEEDLIEANHYAMNGTFSYGYLFESGYIAGYTYLDKAGKPVEKKLNKDKDILVAYYENGNKAIETGISYGRFDGAYKTWHPNGAIYQDAAYINGEQDGEYKSYSANGTLIFTANYMRGEEQGIVKSYYDNGKLQYEEQYVCGSRHGECKYYDKNGTLKYTREYVSGLLVAETKH